MVIVDHWHGITVMGARNVRIVNNSVLDPNDVRPGPPWITITRHKNGTLPRRSVIANNLAGTFNPTGNKRFYPTARKGVTMHANLVVRRPERFFRDPGRFDLRLSPDSPARGAGDARFAPAADIRGTPRPARAAVDAGAYQAR